MQKPTTEHIAALKMMLSKHRDRFTTEEVEDLEQAIVTLLHLDEKCGKLSEDEIKKQPELRKALKVEFLKTAFTLARLCFHPDIINYIRSKFE